MSGSLIDEMQFQGEGWRKLLIIPASQGKVKLLSDFICGLNIGSTFLHVTNPFESALQDMLRQTACSSLLGEEVKGQCFVRIQMEPLGPQLFVLSFF